MSRQLRTHVPAGRVDNTSAHRQLSSSGIGNVLDDVAPADAVACMLSAKTGNVRVTFDGQTPTALLGLVVVAGAQPAYFPIGRRNVRANAKGPAGSNPDQEQTLLAAGDGAAGVLDILWLA